MYRLPQLFYNVFRLPAGSQSLPWFGLSSLSSPTLLTTTAQLAIDRQVVDVRDL